MIYEKLVFFFILLLIMGIFSGLYTNVLSPLVNAVICIVAFTSIFVILILNDILGDKRND